METRHLISDFDLCYRAICSRDARFDGQFFTAVTTTGIYCRPICPARTPFAEHVRFYSCAAAAEAAGFRACRRCHPEVSPGSPEWNVRAGLVARALRLIADGIVDSEGVSGLATRLAVSERHLHRELVAEVGAGPLAIARSRRTQTARLLIDQTQLSLTTIAFTAGFSSIRQFNVSMQAAFGCPPSNFRRNGQSEQQGEGKLHLRLQYRPPFDSDHLLSYFAKRAIPGVEEVAGNLYRRTVTLPHSHGIIEMEPLKQANAIQLRLQLTNLDDLNLVVQRARQLFDLDAVPGAIKEVLARDPLLAPLITTRPGLRVPGAVNGFELAVRAILGQQVSVAGARTLAGRLVTALGTPLEQPQGSLTHLFPPPEVIAQANLQGLGLTTGRIKALQALVHAVTEEGLILDRTADREQTTTHLQQLPGIGPWTTSYIAMRALGDPNAFPAADLGLRRALEKHEIPADLKNIEKRAEAWRPWRAYATHHLWASLAQPESQLKPSIPTITVPPSAIPQERVIEVINGR
ncbi:DNA-3-methyladenine glycosylase [Dictyobacter vulcani]|uniref:DNA-3-methyladenine glycosylase II n=1 Tax=Dictyobacter vulcani TaxID=2607529 RepID=A0A5J4L3X5_9CHLR|nr:DNA-3-methyladenine glycosylase 2 [Dictyobacter vulcani]GER92166.1 DNA-3-methyladenine glycosylase [Dictyobacter vulcani]